MKYRNLKDELNTDAPSEALCDEILANGGAYFDELVEILQDQEQWGEDEDAEGCAAITAATLLGDLKATDAIEPLLDVLDQVEMDSEFAETVVDALSCMEHAVVDPVLRRISRSASDEAQFGFVEILARCGVADDRIFDVLCRELDNDRAFGGVLLGLYGDPRGLALVVRALDAARLKPGKDEPLHAIDVMELCAAVEKLGGTLTDEQAAKKAAANAILDALPEEEAAEDESDAAPAQSAPEPFAFKGHVHSANCGHAHQTPHKRTREKVGPNEPCHCGSGKKYKKCHLFADERARFEA